MTLHTPLLVGTQKALLAGYLDNLSMLEDSVDGVDAPS
jgi:hypothetical protein